MKKTARRALEAWGMRVASVVIAIVLWAVVVSSRTIEVNKEVPISITTAPGLVVANELPDHITFRLSGPKAFLRAILDRHEDPISVYLSGEQPGMRTYQFYSNQIRLPQGIQVVSFSPNTITARLEYLRKKDVPLKVELRSNFPPGVQLSRLEVIPPLVRVRGADTHVEAINEIRSLPVDVSNITQSGDYPLTIEWARVGVQYDGPSPVMRLTLRKSRGE